MVIANEIEFKEESRYAKEELGMKDVVMLHLKKISDICCKEFTGGYWQKRPVRLQDGVFFTEEYHQDTREAYSNAVEFLLDLVAPKGMAIDKEFKTFVTEYEKQPVESLPEKRVKALRIVFKEINKMFERTNFFTSNDSEDE